MKSISKRFFALFLSVILGITMTTFGTDNVKAGEDVIKMNIDGFSITMYAGEDGFGSLWVDGYTGTATEVTLPTEIHYNGKTYYGEGIIGPNAFKGNSTVKKVIIPKGYIAIQDNAFYGCANLKEVVIGGYGTTDPVFWGDNVFTNCPNLKTFRIGYGDVPGGVQTDKDYGFGTDSSGNVYANVTAYVVKGSTIDQNLKAINAKSTGNKINIVYEANPAKAADIKYVIPAGNNSNGVGNQTNVKPYEKGANFDTTDKAVTALSSENDPEGSVYSGLQLKVKKISKTSIKLAWNVRLSKGHFYFLSF